MTDSSEDRRLFREAADLAIRLQNDPGNPVSVEMARSWTARGPKHQAIWARVVEIHGMAGKILSEQREAGEAAPGLSRRSFAIVGAIGLGALGGGAWAVPSVLRRARADHLTSTAEIRRIVLPDGSVMTLGPDSAVAVSYAPSRRSIDLLGGMAYFEVAPDPGRPFSVLAGPLSATALGTAFDISDDAGFISVSVDHGTVEIKAPDSGLTFGQRLNAGNWLILDPSSHGVTRGNREETQIAAWRSGMLVAERETVSAMVARISRWQPGSVVIADPWLGSQVVSGVFDLGNPIRALEAVVRPFGAKARRIGPYMTVIAPL